MNTQMPILDRFAQIPQFTPNTVDQYIALQLARRIADTAHVREYCVALEHFSLDRILQAFSEAHQHPERPTREAFVHHLKSLTQHE